MTPPPALLRPAQWDTWPAKVRARYLDHVRATLAGSRAAGWRPYPWQRPHRHPAGRPPGPCGPDCAGLPDATLDAQETWLLLGGRGTGKTDAAARAMYRHVIGPACDPRIKGGHRPAIVAPTLGDAVESCVNGPSGLASIDPRVRVGTTPGGTFARLPGGVSAKLFGVDTPAAVDRLRAGGNRCLVWLEEAAAMRHLGPALDHVRLGLRVGPAPHIIASTTPKVRPEVAALVADERTVITSGRTRDAIHLPAAVRAELERRYAGTTLGRQEMDAELLADVTGALWTRWLLDQWREPAPEQLDRVAVGLDPNAGGADTAGIIVAGAGPARPDATGVLAPHLHVLADRTVVEGGSPAWAKAAIAAYHAYSADAIVAETNNGGDMIPTLIRQYDSRVRVVVVTATRGKAVRAEPVVGLYEQGRAHHPPGGLPQLEDEQTTWVPGESTWSPGRLDALVWAATWLLLRRRGGVL